MNTPIADFVRRYAERDTARFHMPGHKGVSLVGPESLDITEIDGADVLYSASGIIRESEENAATLFGTARTLYSTEGATLAIKAMLALVAGTAPKGERALVLAARNVHKSFLYGAALLDLDVVWMHSEREGHLCQCIVSPEGVRRAIAQSPRLPQAVYLTSPDYLGNSADVEGIAKVCHAHGIPLLVDNAHGSYLHFLDAPSHPIDLGADLVADSAHKTLPALTGTAYLHIGKKAPAAFAERAEEALSLFASTSPSYLLLQSLDCCNKVLAEEYPSRLTETVSRVASCKERLLAAGIPVARTEPLKIAIEAYRMGYTGEELARHLAKGGVTVEFADCEYVVLMCSPYNTERDFHLVEALLTALPLNPSHPAPPVVEEVPLAVLSPREAMLSPSLTVPVKDAEGRILAAPAVSCPPAVPVVMCGERITAEAVSLFLHYGIDTVRVVAE